MVCAEDAGGGDGFGCFGGGELLFEVVVLCCEDFVDFELDEVQVVRGGNADVHADFPAFGFALFGRGYCPQCAVDVGCSFAFQAAFDDSACHFLADLALQALSLCEALDGEEGEVFDLVEEVVGAEVEADWMSILLLDLLEEAWVLTDIANSLEVMPAGIANEVVPLAFGEVAKSMG